VSTPSERLLILERLEKGEITPDEAARQLAGASATPSTPLDILGQVERGEINADEAASRLESAKARVHSESAAGSSVKTEFVDKRSFDAARTWGWWLLPIAGGLVLTLLAAMWMSSSFANNGALSFGFLCAWFPLAIGLLLVVVGWAMRNGHWLHLQVSSNKPGRRMKLDLDMPLPTQLATGLMEGFGVHIPGIDKDSVDKIVTALHEGKNSGHPLHIQANDEEDDDIVDIVIS
jgi:hypothetical protein